MTVRKQSLINWGLIVGIWTGFAFFYSTQTLIQNPFRHAPLVWWRTFVWELLFGYLWVALTPVIIWLAGRFPFEKGRRLTSLLVYIFASLFVSAIHLTFYAAASPVMPYYEVTYSPSNTTIFANYQYLAAIYFHFNFICFWVILFADYLVKYYRAFQERALKASQLEASLAQSQLQILKTQLQPHFLFNTLNTISELVHEDEEIADKMIARLSGLLRMSLDADKAQEVSLADELEFLEKYLDIEQARFEDRLNVNFEIEKETFDAQVPNMILQPLVENAVRYAIAPRATGGNIKIRAERKDEKLYVEIEDDGEDLPFSAAVNFKEGIGLSNTRARLDALYGTAHRFELKAAPGGGLCVNIEIPFRTSESEIER